MTTIQYYYLLLFLAFGCVCGGFIKYAWPLCGVAVIFVIAALCLRVHLP